MDDVMVRNLWQMEAASIAEIRAEVSRVLNAQFEWTRFDQMRRSRQRIFSQHNHMVQVRNPVMVKIKELMKQLRTVKSVQAALARAEAAEHEIEAAGENGFIGFKFVGGTLAVPNNKKFIPCLMVSGVENLPIELVGENQAKKVLLRIKSEELAHIIAKEVFPHIEVIKVLIPTRTEIVTDWIKGSRPSLRTLCLVMLIAGTYLLGKKVDDITIRLGEYLREWAKAGYPPLITINPRVTL